MRSRFLSVRRSVVALSLASSAAVGCVEGPSPPANRTAPPMEASSASRPSAQTSVASVATAAPAPAGAPPPVVAACGGLADRFQKITRYHATCDLYGAQKREELPPALAWAPCSAPADGSAPPKGCAELGAPRGFALEARVDRSVSPPLLVLAGDAGPCALVVMAHLDGSIVNAAAARPVGDATCKSLAKTRGSFAVGGGGFMLGLSGEERTADRHESIPHRAWLEGRADAFVTSASIADDRGEQPASLADKLWVSATGELASLGAKKPSSVWGEPASLAIAAANDAAVAVDAAGTRVAIGREGEAPKGGPAILFTAPSGSRVLGLGSDGKTIAWVEATGDRCVVAVSPFATTKGELHRREVGVIPCDWSTSPSKGPVVLTVTKEAILVGPGIVRERDGRRWDTKTALGCTSAPRCQAELLGLEEGLVYWQDGVAVRRAPLDAFGEGAAADGAKP